MLSTPESEGLNAATIDRWYASAARLSNIYSLVVARNGRLVAEQYFNGATLTLASSTRPSTTFDSTSWTQERAVLELVFGLIGSL